MKDLFEVWELTELNGKVFFVGQDFLQINRELWTSDGTEAGTQLVVDIFPGPSSAIQAPTFCVSNGFLFFAADDGQTGTELWKTDGTAAGTSLVRDIHPGPIGSFPAQMRSLARTLFFQAYDTEHGLEPWTSDGTESGTHLIADLEGGELSSSPSHFSLLNNDLYFFAETVDKGLQLWEVQDVISEEEVIFIYPNPTASLLKIDTENTIESIRIYGVDGRLIQEINPRVNQVDVEGLTAGIYLLAFEVDGESITKKFVKR